MAKLIISYVISLKVCGACICRTAGLEDRYDKDAERKMNSRRIKCLSDFPGRTTWCGGTKKIYVSGPEGQSPDNRTLY